MSASAPEATAEHSSRLGPETGSRGRLSNVHLALVGIALLGALLTAISTFLPVLEAVTDNDTPIAGSSQTGLETHSVAMLLLGLAAVPMILGAMRNARPAMIALVAIGILIIVVALLVDLPNATEEGLYGERYEGASATPRIGFFVETAGGMLLVLAGGLLLLRGRD